MHWSQLTSHLFLIIGLKCVQMHTPFDTINTPFWSVTSTTYQLGQTAQFTHVTHMMLLIPQLLYVHIALCGLG